MTSPTARVPAGITVWPPADDELGKLWESKTPNDPATFDLARDSVATFEARRRKAYAPIGDEPAGHYVGGEIHMTKISRSGVDWTVIHEWPDKVGEPIVPANVRQT